MPDHDDQPGSRDVSEPASEPATSSEALPALPESRPRPARGLTLGYRADEVDPFLDELDGALRRERPTMAPYEVADARFRVTRLRRRYPMRAVDEYLEAAQGVLREKHGTDAVADVEGHLAAPRPVRTTWIYAVALVLVLVIVAFAVYSNR